MLFWNTHLDQDLVVQIKMCKEMYKEKEIYINYHTMINKGPSEVKAIWSELYAQYISMDIN